MGFVVSLETGTRLGSYEVVASIGVGAMGEVYRAKDLKLGREVALKVLPAEFSSDPDRLRRFVQEARAASALNHPNIVHIYDIGQEVDIHFIAMELVQGVTLRKLLVGSFTIERVLELGRQMAAGLAAAHAAGIIHRDIKPENMMVTADGLVKILDFGLAKLLEVPFETHSEMATMARLGTRHGMLIGTVEYMSPEQAAGKPVDHRSDQFSLGLILYEMVTGKLAFRRETAAQTLASIIESEPRAMRDLNASCPGALARIVHRCLRKNASERYPETSELVRALKTISVEEELWPPLPPVPQHTEPDAPVFGLGLGAVVDREIDRALANVDDQLTIVLGDAGFQLQSDDGRTRSISERRLRKGLRRNRYSGTELVRGPGDSEWMPLYESTVFREEVPYRGDPADSARIRKLKGFGQHACVFVCFGFAWYLFAGEVPFWMGFWGIGLAMHAMGTVPAALPLLRRSLGREERTGAIDVLPNPPELSDGLLTPSFHDEVTKVKELLKKRGGSESASLVEEVDGIVTRMAGIATMHRDLSEQTSAEERARLAEALVKAESRLVAAESASDRRLYQRQLDVLRQRQQTIEKALAVIDRLAIRQDVAGHQIKQLRLELSRADASSASIPELTSKLQDIRHEVDATEQVDEAIAQELLS